MTVRVLIADDQEMVRAGFRLILKPHPGIEVVGEAGDGREAVEAAWRLRPDVVLMDIRMPGLDGLQATRELLAAGAPSRVRVLILTTFDLDSYVYEALRAGASGFLLKDAPPEQLVAGIRTVANGEALLAPSITRRLIEGFINRPPAHRVEGDGLDELTPREREVLQLLGQGLSNTELAEQLCVSEATVKTHVNRVFSKLGFRDRVQAVVFAYEKGLVQPAQRGATPG
jgi:DNA-binding NarL/FixJ family response regulator